MIGKVMVIGEEVSLDRLDDGLVVLWSVNLVVLALQNPSVLSRNVRFL